MCYLFNVEFSEPLSNIYSHHKLIENITVILKFQRAQVEKDRLPLHLTLSEFCFFPPVVSVMNSIVQLASVSNLVNIMLDKDQVVRKHHAFIFFLFCGRGPDSKINLYWFSTIFFCNSVFDLIIRIMLIHFSFGHVNKTIFKSPSSIIKPVFLFSS